MKTKLAYLCGSTSWGGLEMNHLRNAQWMQERGHELIVIGIQDSPFHQRAEEMNLPFIGVRAYKKYYDFKAAKIILNHLKTEQVTHLLVRSSNDLSVSAIIKRKMGSAIHTSYFMEMQLGIKKKSIAHTIRYKYLDLWSCPLNWLKEQVETMTRFNNELVVIPSGLDLAIGHDAPTRLEARKQLDLPESDLTFGLVGRFDPQKGQLLLLEAMKKCKATDFRVVLLGEPTKNEGQEYTDKMTSVAESLGDRVIIRPFRKDISTFYTAIDWMVMATKAETFGMVTIEALACGTPVLGSNAGGTPEILSIPNGGHLFETMNIEDLARQIDYICQEQPAFKQEKLKKMAEHYDHHRVCDAVERVLKIQ